MFGCLVTYMSIFDLFPFFYTIITYLVLGYLIVFHPFSSFELGVILYSSIC